MKTGGVSAAGPVRETDGTGQELMVAGMDLWMLEHMPSCCSNLIVHVPCQAVPLQHQSPAYSFCPIKHHVVSRHQCSHDHIVAAAADIVYIGTYWYHAALWLAIPYPPAMTQPAATQFVCPD